MPRGSHFHATYPHSPAGLHASGVRHIPIDPSIAAVVLPCREKKKKKRKSKTRRAILRAGIGEEGLWGVETMGVEQREEARRVENLPNLTDSSTFVRDRREEDGLCLPEGRERT